MTIKLVASDLDGTFFGPEHYPTERTVAAVNALVDQGTIAAAVTGRSWHDGLELSISTGARLEWFIGSNGGHRVNVATRDIEERLLFDADELGSFLQTVKGEIEGLAFAYEHREGMWFDDLLLELFPRSTVDDSRRMNTFTPDGLDGVGKLFAVHKEIQTVALVERLKPHAPDSMQVTTSGIRFAEVTPDGGDKGSALARLCAQLGIDRTEVIAFGDNYNDVTMLQWAGRGVAMGNAPDEIKAIADEVTASNEEDGVAQVLETLLG